MKKLFATLTFFYLSTFPQITGAIEMIHEVPHAIEMPSSIKMAFGLDLHKTIIIAFVVIVCLGLLCASGKKRG